MSNSQSFRDGAKRRTRNPDAHSEDVSGFRVRSLRSHPGMTANFDPLPNGERERA